MAKTPVTRKPTTRKSLARKRATPAKKAGSRTRTAAPTGGVSRTVIEDSPTTTGRYLVLLHDDGVAEGVDAIRNVAGVRQFCYARDFTESAVNMAKAGDSEVLVLENVKIAVVSADPRQASALRAAAADQQPIIAVEPEQIMYALQPRAPMSPLPPDLEAYLRGYRDAVDQLYEALTSGVASAADLVLPQEFLDDAAATWGLHATKAVLSRFTGAGVRIAVLDTGFDLQHPDFAGRVVEHQSFIAGESVQDVNGHGTHCIGTAMGPRTPRSGVRRYGVAHGAEIFAGKVLSNAGSGADSGILAGINWAIENRCRIISMSLGAAVRPGEAHSAIYETVARRALQSKPGTLIVAAAGNSSRGPGGRRREPPNPVGRPANCPSIMAVAAVDSRLGVAAFSDGGINPNGGGIDIAGPGVDVFSSLPVSRGTHGSLDGTSMATPHVAGLGALWLEARGVQTTAEELWQLLTSNAMRLTLPSRDVGSGLVQAPFDPMVG